MERHFRQIANVFAHYKDVEKQLDGELARARESGNFSKNYLSSMATANVEKLKETHLECVNTLGKIRAEFESELRERNDLLSRPIGERLKAVLDAGFDLSLDEWRILALKSRNNPVESRLIHDRAKAQGVTVENYISTDDALKTVDRLIANVKDSMFGVNPIVAPFPTVEAAEHDAGMCWKICKEPTFDVYYTPKTLNDAVRLGYEKHERESQPTEAMQEAFETGFGTDINRNMLANEAYIDADELETMKKISDLERQENEHLDDLEETYGKESMTYADKASNIKNAFGRQIERFRNKLDEIRAENERKAEEKMDV